MSALSGLTAQGAQLRDGDSLLFSLLDEARAYRWNVRVYSIAWRIESESDVVVGAGDDGDVLRRAVAIVDGKVLRAVQVEAPSLDTTFAFDGCRLRVFPVTARSGPGGWQQWSLRSPAGRIVDIGPGASWSWRESGTGGAHSS
ncbi:hypothetical protein [Micromonospora sp. NPDC005171]|uniref:hypothetical protein n=1 Tax=Micromonospora sp. NPDC005171 TaxID=3156866 RepID=UPI0033A4702F